MQPQADVHSCTGLVEHGDAESWAAVAIKHPEPIFLHGFVRYHPLLAQHSAPPVFQSFLGPSYRAFTYGLGIGLVLPRSGGGRPFLGVGVGVAVPTGEQIPLLVAKRLQNLLKTATAVAVQQDAPIISLGDGQAWVLVGVCRA